MKKNLLIALTLLSTTFNFAQEKELKTLKAEQAKYKNFGSKEERAIFESHFKTIEHTITQGFTKENFIVDAKFTTYFQKIFNRLKTANQYLDLGDPMAYVVKQNAPNATSLGYNYYLIYSGLFHLTENEHQLAAILGHEIAHNYLNHIQQDIQKEAEFVKDFKKELKSIKKNEFIKLIKSQDEIIQKKYDLASQSRAKEIQADSLGFILYTNAKYPASEYLHMLHRLEEFDQKNTSIIKDSTYHQLFEIEDIHLNPTWLNLEKDELFSGLTFTEHVNQDSINTHPNTLDRIKWVKEKFSIHEANHEIEKASGEFLALKDVVKNEFYQTFFHNNNYAIALYLLVLEKQEGSNRKDLDQTIAQAFLKLYDSRLNHAFNKYVPVANANDEDEDYNKFLHFLWNLSTTDLKKIGDYYTKKAAL